MKYLKLLFLLLIVLILCSCNKNNNGAHEYNTSIEKEKLNNSAIVSERIGEDLGFHNNSSCYSYKGDTYTFFLEENNESKLYISHQDGEYKEIVNEYRNIDKYIQVDKIIYLHCLDSKGLSILVKMDDTGKTINVVEADYCEELFFNGKTIFFISIDFDDNFLVTEYDQQLNKLQEFNLSKTICSNKELLLGIKYHDGSFYLLKAGNIINRDSNENISDLKIVKYDINTSKYVQILNLFDVTEAENFSDFYVSQEGLRIVCHERDNYFIKYMDLYSGKMLKESVPFSADRIFSGGYCYDGILYNYDNTQIFDSNSEIIEYNAGESNDSILIYERKMTGHICRIDNSELTIEERILTLPNIYFNETGISKCDDFTAFIVNKNQSGYNSILVADKNDNVNEVILSEISILDVEINRKEIIYISDNTVYKKSLSNADDVEVIRIKGNPLTLGKNNENDIILLSAFEGKVILYKYCEDSFVELEEIKMIVSSDKLELINGNEYAEFYIKTSESVYSYSDNNLELVIDIVELNQVCDISGISVVDSNNYIIVGRNRKSYAVEIYSASKANDIRKNIIQIIAEPGVEAKIYEIISDYNKNQKENLVVLKVTEDIVNDIPDIYIYSSMTDVNKYISNQMFLDLSKIIDSEDFLPVSLGNYQIFSFFSIRLRNNNINSDTKCKANEIINDFMFFDLEKYYNYNLNKYDFLNDKFYQTLNYAKNGSSLYEYKNYYHIQELLANWNCSSESEYIIIPDFFISVFNSSKGNKAIDFIDYFIANSNTINTDFGTHDKLCVSKEYYLDYAKRNKINESEICNIIDIISNAKPVPVFNEKIYNIINECINEYCEANVSEDIISERINKRINIYLAERK